MSWTLWHADCWDDRNNYNYFDSQLTIYLMAKKMRNNSVTKQKEQEASELTWFKQKNNSITQAFVNQIIFGMIIYI